jgi:hypothetical protein
VVAFRCVPYGTQCVFSTNDESGTARLYNVSLTTGTVTPCSFSKTWRSCSTTVTIIPRCTACTWTVTTQSIAMFANGTTQVVGISEDSMCTILDLSLATASSFLPAA